MTLLKKPQRTRSSQKFTREKILQSFDKLRTGPRNLRLFSVDSPIQFQNYPEEVTVSQAFEDIIQRAGKDPAFRQLLLNDPQKALEGYAVADDERKMLANLDEAQIDQFAGKLGNRTTKGKWTAGFG